MPKEKVERNTPARIGQGSAILGAIVAAIASVLTLIAIIFNIGEEVGFVFLFLAVSYSGFIVLLLSAVIIAFEIDIIIHTDFLDRGVVYFLVGLFFIPCTLLIMFAGVCYFIAAWIPGKPPSHIDL